MSEQDQTQGSKYCALLAAGIGLTAAMLMLSLMFWALIVTERRETSRVAETIVQRADDILREGNATLEEISHLRAPPCSDALLSEFREKLIRDRNVGDIVVFEPHSSVIVCSAIVGRLHKRYSINEPGAVSPKFVDRTTWSGVELGFLQQGRRYHLIKQNDIGIAMFPSFIERYAEDTAWSLDIVNGNGKRVAHSYGDARLFAAFGKSDFVRTFRETFSQKCSFAQASFCVTTARTLNAALFRNRLSGVTGIALCILVSVIVAVLSFRKLRALRSPSGRVIRSLRQGQKDNFQCVYQPIVCMKTRAVVGCEVLARYGDAVGHLPPSQFVPIIDSAGMTWQFTEIVIANVVRDMKDLNCPAGFRVSINFYPRDLEANQLETIRNCNGFRTLKNCGFQLVCEILETGIGDVTAMAETIAYLKDIGFRIAIDDFGTGTSNLKQLKDIRPDYLKIDKSFVDDIGEDQTTVKGCMVPHILTMAKEIGTEVIVEGVETAVQADILVVLGAEFGQGYLFAKPLTIEGLRAMLASQEAHAVDAEAAVPSSRAEHVALA